MHLLLGHPEDSCCAGVLARLEGARSAGPHRCVTADTAGAARLAPRRRRAREPLTWDDRPTPSSPACWCAAPAGSIPPAGTPADHAYMQAEVLAATLAWLAGLSCPVINRPDAALWYRAPRPAPGLAARSCAAAASASPDVLVTNDPAEARAFGRRLAADGVAGAVYTPLTGETPAISSPTTRPGRASPHCRRGRRSA